MRPVHAAGWERGVQLCYLLAVSPAHVADRHLGLDRTSPDLRPQLAVVEPRVAQSEAERIERPASEVPIGAAVADVVVHHRRQVGVRSHPSLRQPACGIVVAEESARQSGALLLAVVRQMQDRRRVLLRPDDRVGEAAAQHDDRAGVGLQKPPQKGFVLQGQSAPVDPLLALARPLHLGPAGGAHGLVPDDRDDDVGLAGGLQSLLASLGMQHAAIPSEPLADAPQGGNPVRRQAAVPVQQNLVRVAADHRQRAEALRVQWKEPVVLQEHDRLAARLEGQGSVLLGGPRLRSLADRLVGPAAGRIEQPEAALDPQEGP